MTTVFVTGASGFVGKALCEVLLESGFSVKAAVRQASQKKSSSAQFSIVEVGDINSSTNWDAALQGVDVVIHLAARAHIMKDTVENPLSAFRAVNVDGTANLLEHVVQHKVRRFIYLSSIKAMGEQTEGAPFTVHDKECPLDPYGVSKLEAEQVLQKMAANSALEVVIIRPPLVYGPGVKGNFLRLIKLVDRGWFIPLGGVKNYRSMVNLDNLCDLIKLCIVHPNAKGQVILASDNQDLSTPELIRLLADLLGRPVRLLPVPVQFLRKLAELVGKRSEIERLCGSLQLDIKQTEQLLDWRPPFSVTDGVKKTIGSYIAESNRKKCMQYSKKV